MKMILTALRSIQLVLMYFLNQTAVTGQRAVMNP